MKNLILILFLFFIYGCGYTPVYKNLEESNFQINLTEMLGDRDMNNLIKNQIDLYSNKNSVNKYNISVDTKYKRETLTKNSAGVISDYRRDASDPNSLVIMLTGRIPPVGKHVKAILDAKGLKFDDYLYNEGGATEDEKIRHMEMILKYNPNIREVEMFDDRTPHKPHFQAWGDEMIAKGYLDKFHVNHIPGFRH